MTTSPIQRTGWRLHALAAISEGLCPNGHGTLGYPDRWCTSCGCVYATVGDTVVCSYNDRPQTAYQAVSCGCGICTTARNPP